MSQLNEELLAGDLEDLLEHIFEVDCYKSKIGADADIAVVTFTLSSLAAAKDLVNFLERGYDFVLDADYTPGELNDGKYKVFTEIERTKRIADQIEEMLNGIKKLTKLDELKFRYYKAFHSLDATHANLVEYVPSSKEDYQHIVDNKDLSNFSNFFNRSYLESINIDKDDLVFQKKYTGPLRMKIINFGDSHEIYNNIEGKVMFEHKDVGEVLFLTKYLGEYNIAKIGDSFVFENDRKVLILKRV